MPYIQHFQIFLEIPGNSNNNTHILTQLTQSNALCHTHLLHFSKHITEL